MGTTRNAFDKMLEAYKAEILKMGKLAEAAVEKAVLSLAQQDLELVRQVIKGDDVIDTMLLEIEDLSMKLIATQQPMAKDLRQIGTGFKIITDLERIGDHAVQICKITRRLSDQPLIKPLVDIPRMAKVAQEILSGVLEAYIKEDADMVKEIAKRDDEVDAIYKHIFEELVGMMEKKPETVYQATHLLMACRYIERIADHATNIGERLVYQQTGIHQDLNH